MAKVDLSDKLRQARARIAAETDEDVVDAIPKYAQLTRKETRVREDQYAALSALARSLMRRRRAKGERITETTLIRIAIDLLLEHQHALRGASEEQLRNSVTSVLRDREAVDQQATAHSSTPSPEERGTW